MAKRIPNAKLNATLYFERRTLLIPVDISTATENQGSNSHFWPYVISRKFYQCTYDRNAAMADAVKAVFRKDLTVEYSEDACDKDAGQEWINHYIEYAYIFNDSQF